MIAQVIAAIITLAKGSKAVDDILQQLTTAYTAYKTAENNASQAAKDDRNAALIRAAGGVQPRPDAAAGDSAGQHGEAPPAPPV